MSFNSKFANFGHFDHGICQKDYLKQNQYSTWYIQYTVQIVINCIKEFIVEPIITIEKLYYDAVVTELWIMIIIIQWHILFLYFLCTFDRQALFYFTRTITPKLDDCSELNVKIGSCFLLKFWEISSSLVEPWVVRMPQSNLMKRSWSLCVSILLIMKILSHIQRHMTKRNTATSKTRGPQHKEKGWFLFTQIQTP